MSTKPSDVHDATYYFKCMIGGMLACGLTHAAIVPLDVVKCMRQVNPGFSKSLGEGLSKIKAEGKLTLGVAPTLIGYSAQGLGKFGFYEIFKDVYKKIVGAENADKYKKIGWSIASGSAEVIADTLLCPWEAIKLKIQLSRPGSEYPSQLGAAIAKLRADEGTNGFYKGLAPLWARQVPYTIVKFVAFEWFVQMFYDNVFTKGKENYSKPTQLGVTFASGYLAGIFCAIVSHPADTMVSKLYSQGKGDGSLGSKIGKIYGEIGFRGLWAGLVTRIIMIGTLTGLQWWIYDSFKTAVGLATTGGGSKPAPSAVAAKH
jgi:solute carrier family 25 phosphate transporter 3